MNRVTGVGDGTMIMPATPAVVRMHARAGSSTAPERHDGFSLHVAIRQLPDSS